MQDAIGRVRSGRQVSVVGRVRSRLGRLVAPPDAEVRLRLDHHDHALRDITAALQEVQAVVGAASDHQAEIRKLQLRLDLIEQHLPEILSITSTSRGTQRRFQRQLDDAVIRSESHADSIKELWQRVEFVRRELMFEMRYDGRGGGAAVGRESGAVEPLVVDHSAVDEAVEGGTVRLNLGCGHIPVDGYLNVDVRELPGVDIVAEVGDLPFDEGTVEEIFSAHLLEHFPEERLTREILPYWRSRLRADGTLRAVVPDAGAMIAGFTAGSIPFSDLRAVLYGGQEYEGDFHFTMFDATSITGLLERTGFTDVVIEAQGRPNDICLELQVSARRDG